MLLGEPIWYLQYVYDYDTGSKKLSYHQIIQEICTDILAKRELITLNVPDDNAYDYPAEAKGNLQK